MGSSSVSIPRESNLVGGSSNALSPSYTVMCIVTGLVVCCE